jgi:cystathionine beta-lyase family protein involved in aluminum resistance
MKKMLERKFNLILPKTKSELEAMERVSGYFFDDLGLNILENTLYGDILQSESLTGKSGLHPHKTSWQYPIEKYYGGRK